MRKAVGMMMLEALFSQNVDHAFGAGGDSRKSRQESNDDFDLGIDRHLQSPHKVN